MTAPKFGEARKSITAAVGVGIGFATLVVVSEPKAITSAEWLSLAIGVATALGVYGNPNDQQPEPWEPPTRSVRQVAADAGQSFFHVLGILVAIAFVFWVLSALLAHPR